jgi:hypothetical protein
MYYQKLTKSQKEDKLRDVMKLKNEIEFDNNPIHSRRHPESRIAIVEWKEFLKLPAPEQERRKRAWVKYYEDVKTTPIFALFQEMRVSLRLLTSKDPEVAKEARMRVRELSEQSQRMQANGDLSTLEKPPFADPWEMERGWVQSYQDCERVIKELQRDLSVDVSGEAQDVWGR